MNDYDSGSDPYYLSFPGDLVDPNSVMELGLFRTVHGLIFHILPPVKGMVNLTDSPAITCFGEQSKEKVNLGECENHTPTKLKYPNSACAND